MGPITTVTIGDGTIVICARLGEESTLQGVMIGFTSTAGEYDLV